jgi:4-amino-4-deoxy-L-arabinose transferase-like glycosyltransferase
VLALAYGLGTIAFPYSTTLIQHQMAAFGVFVGFYLLWCVVYEDASERWLWLVGVLFGLVAITEYPVVIIVGIVFLWAVYAMPNRLALYRVVIGAIPLGLIFAAYNFAIFSTPVPVGYEYSTLWQDVHNSGFMSLTGPSLLRYYGLLFSPVRGLFLLSPFLLLMIPGVILMWRRRADQRSVNIALTLAVFVHLTIYASSEMWWGGSTVGPRYLVPMLPFMIIPMSFVANTLFTRRWGIALTGILVALSVGHVWALTIAGNEWQWSGNLAATWEEMNATLPLSDYAIPLLNAGDVARNYGGLLLNLDGLAGLIPLIIVVLVIGVGLPYLMLNQYSTRKVHHNDVKSGVTS